MINMIENKKVLKEDKGLEHYRYIINVNQITIITLTNETY